MGLWFFLLREEFNGKWIWVVAKLFFQVFGSLWKMNCYEYYWTWSFEIIKIKLGEKEVAKIIEYIEAKTEKAIADEKDVLATKEDLAKVKFDIIRWVFGFFVVLILAIVGLYFKW